MEWNDLRTVATYLESNRLEQQAGGRGFDVLVIVIETAAQVWGIWAMRFHNAADGGAAYQ